ncbi:hypothetical protein CQ010_01295 [Arthrobacter sp. MYb211]|nr:hypothetical protein CQ015_03550 [Arthrobacter sp. MYb221]PRC10506.1 hypothetical protein CQ010_01295 [Arthrobacter sp. MYb211]
MQISHRLNKQTWDPETHRIFEVDTTPWEKPGRMVSEKRWTPRPFNREGVIVGMRIVTNNWVSGDEYGAGLAVATKHITTYLVAYDMRKAPVNVDPEHMVRVP